MGRDPSGPVLPENQSEPVRRVTHAQAVEFCERLSAREGKRYRLPTEAEWEYACRAGTTGSFAGNGNPDDMGWHEGNGPRSPSRVGLKLPNAWGLYDMHGNVAEWVADTYGPYSSALRDPVHTTRSFRNVARGGDFRSAWHFCRSAHRRAADPKLPDPAIGFRPLLERE